MRKHISRVNRAETITQGRKRTSLSEAVFLGISLQITVTITFKNYQRYNCIL